MFLAFQISLSWISDMIKRNTMTQKRQPVINWKMYFSPSKFSHPSVSALHFPSPPYPSISLSYSLSLIIFFFLSYISCFTLRILLFYLLKDRTTVAIEVPEWNMSEAELRMMTSYKVTEVCEKELKPFLKTWIPNAKLETLNNS